MVLCPPEAAIALPTVVLGLRFATLLLDGVVGWYWVGLKSAGCGRPAVFSGAAARARRPEDPLSASAGGRDFVAFGG